MCVDMCGFWSLEFDNSVSNIKVLDLLTVCKIVIERIVVIEFRMDNGGGNGAGCFEVEIWADTAKFTDMIVARFIKCRDLVR